MGKQRELYDLNLKEVSFQNANALLSVYFVRDSGVFVLIFLKIKGSYECLDVERHAECFFLKRVWDVFDKGLSFDNGEKAPFQNLR